MSTPKTGASERILPSHFLSRNILISMDFEVRKPDAREYFTCFSQNSVAEFTSPVNQRRPLTQARSWFILEE
jgi:hypothetical protein